MADDPVSNSCKPTLTPAFALAMKKTFSLSILFFLMLGLLFASYATIPA
jgi:hypothetical protein